MLFNDTLTSRIALGIWSVLNWIKKNKFVVLTIAAVVVIAVLVW